MYMCLGVGRKGIWNFHKNVLTLNKEVVHGTFAEDKNTTLRRNGQTLLNDHWTPALQERIMQRQRFLYRRESKGSDLWASFLRK